MKTWFVGGLFPILGKSAQWFEGPSGNRASWLEDLKVTRKSALEAVNYTGGVFSTPGMKWSQTSYIQPQMHPYDRFFYNISTHNYTVDYYLDDLERRYGGIDALLMWPTYPHLGIDDRNQFDMFRVMPGGLPAVKQITDQLHKRGVRVLWPYNPWDTGTRREGKDDDAALAQLIAQTNGDGANGDTMQYFDEAFWANSVALNHPLAQEPEDESSDTSLNYQTMGWGEGTPYLNPPVVDRYRWLESRFMMNICDRWNTHKGQWPLQVAFFNGAGLETWENVWSCWVQLTQGDGEAIRRGATILRYMGGKGFLQSADWEPHVETMSDGVYASMFPSGGEAVWHLINLAEEDVEGDLIALELPENTTLYDCYRGVPATTTKTSFLKHKSTNCYSGHGAIDIDVNGQHIPLSQCQNQCLQNPSCTGFVYDEDSMTCWRRADINLPACDSDGTYSTFTLASSGAVVVSMAIEQNGLGCLLASKQGTPSGDLQGFLANMKQMTIKPLSSYNWEWEVQQQTMIDIAPSPAPGQPPGMVLLPAQPAYTFVTFGLEIEHSIEETCDFQFPWESQPGRSHNHTLSVGALYIDKYPVTTAAYAEYLSKTGYIPRDPTRWLINWKGSRTPPSNISNVPVTYIALHEAREFCAWRGARLPHSWEWQYAAQGTDNRVYPWGNNGWNAPVAVPSNDYPGPEPVDRYPAGCSPFGVCDLVGNVWQMTDEFEDLHSRMILLKGGANYKPNGDSEWYFPQAYQVAQHNRFTMMDDSYDRAGTVGFRCVADVM